MDYMSIELAKALNGGAGGGGNKSILALLKGNACKNILPNNGVNKTVNGITFTVNSDGTITANGTATADSYYNIAKVTPGENLILSGCPAGGSATTYFLYIQDTVTSDRLATDTGEGADITESANPCNVNICIRAGEEVTGLVFNPMIRNNTLSADYETYYPTNITLGEMLPSAPTSAGTYTLTCEVDSSGNTSYKWT